MPTGIYARESKTATCHPTRRLLAKGLCAECYHKEKNSTYWKNNKHIIYPRKRDGHLKELGWSLKMVEEKILEQDNKCAVCFVEFTETPHADHKHVVPPIPRGLLCSPCNRALGLLKDDPALLRKAAAYIEKY